MSENNQLMKRIEELKQDLIERKNPLLLIQDGINKALQKTKEELRTVKEKNKTSNVPFVSTFNPNNPEPRVVWDYQSKWEEQSNQNDYNKESTVKKQKTATEFIALFNKGKIRKHSCGKHRSKMRKIELWLMQTFTGE